MTRELLAIAVLFILPCSLKAQDQESAVTHQTSALPSDARFEIFQAGLGLKWTLRLDRITSNVERLVSAKTGDFVWEKTRVLPHPKAVNTTKPHFQIFVSGLPNQVTLLLDTESGATWQLVPKDDRSLWQPIE